MAGCVFHIYEHSLLLSLDFVYKFEINCKLVLSNGGNEVQQTLLVNSNLCLIIFQGNNPFISVMLNDGNQIYDHNK